MLIALPEVSLCLGSVVCGLIWCIDIVIYRGGTLYVIPLLGQGCAESSK